MAISIPKSSLIIDVAGFSLDEKDKQRLFNPLVGGIILFSRNYESRNQLIKLTKSIKKIRPDILISTDHEGGRVQRFKTDGFTHLAAMQKLGDIYNINPDLAKLLAKSMAYIMAAELIACGVDFSFAPVLDLNWGNSSVIGDRAFSNNYEIVSQLAHSFSKAMMQAGMKNCAKHFPAHGFAMADTHTHRALDNRSLDEIYKADMIPYDFLNQNQSLSAVMPSHIIYEKVDNMPAGFSQKWLQDILRGQLNFQGAIISDDLSMHSARHINGQILSHSKAIEYAINAGCDLVLVCNQSINEGNLDEILSSFIPNDNPASTKTRDLLKPNTSLPNNSWDSLMKDYFYIKSQELLAENGLKLN